MNFDWDQANIEHIARHNIIPEEVEEALSDRQKIGISTYQGENEQRWAAIAKSGNGRILFIVFTRRNGLIRIVTARDTTDKEKRRYRR
ncbi:hypothetical protein GM3708_2326 [Geminocystis sp. NIES-3708]|uniref:BrnT family toxin n=1 Tax=Geminocystis sp. NIES-3708 TaxID=1615909 RepID=UPI0005FCAF3B|nr:BrnT family toxin [Geminocystis sp. NIES-3708]BAQ61920.1 hypothetical protein GM3708_2326 [Geminocystis sp. NIES-3708]